MRNLTLLISFFISVLLFSCRKDIEALTPADDTISPIPHQLPSDSGTFWVYETFLIDSLGNEVTSGDIDTVIIIGDSTINGNNYVVYLGMGINPWTLTFLRDSSGYIVRETGHIFYHTLPNDDTIRFLESAPNVFSWYYKMNGDMISKTVPYATFNCFEHNSIAFYSNGDPVNVCGDESYISRNYFDPYLGLISRQYAYISEQELLCSYREQRLIDYYHP